MMPISIPSSTVAGMSSIQNTANNQYKQKSFYPVPSFLGNTSTEPQDKFQLNVQHSYDSPAAIKNSCYLGDSENGAIFPLNSDVPVPADKKAVFQEFKEYIVGDKEKGVMKHPCVGANTAMRRQTYRIGCYDQIGTGNAAQGLGRDLESFLKERELWKKSSWRQPFTPFIAIFDGPIPKTEKEFEHQLWKQLTIMAALEKKRHPWSDAQVEELKNGEFKFRFNNRVFFVAGLNPTSPRSARNFSKPVFIFNLQEQFDQLRAEGKFDALQKQIRQNDIKTERYKHADGTINPNLDKPESAQYAGIRVGKDWMIPVTGFLTTLKGKK